MEYNSIVRSQVGTLELKQGQYSKYLPYVFTEQGVAMLSSVIRTEVASRVNVNIMRAFVSQRHYLLNNQLEQKYINNIVLENTQKIKEHDNSIKLLNELFDDLRVDKEINELYFDGKEWDAYSKLLDIFSSCEKELIIIDRYLGIIILRKL